MKVNTIIRDFSKKLKSLHKSRVKTMGYMVTSLLEGGYATLTQIGRNLPGKAKTKHKIKRVDRFLRNKGLKFSDITPYLLEFLPVGKPVLLIIDWTPHQHNRHQILSAKIPIDGRCIPVYCEPHLWKGCEQTQAEMKFLEELHKHIGNKRQVIVIFDRGFRLPFWKRIRELGWDYIGRLQSSYVITDGEKRFGVSTIKLKEGVAKDFGMVKVGEDEEKNRLVVYKAPKGRRRSPAKKKKHAKELLRYKNGAKQPWYLTSSLDWSAEAIVTGYAQRFQIEESFRDWKNHRFCGYNLGAVRCSSPERLEKLLMIIALAYVIQIGWGIIGAEKGMELDFRANRSDRKSLGVFFLGRELLRRAVPWRLSQIAAAIKRSINRVLIYVMNGLYIPPKELYGGLI